MHSSLLATAILLGPIATAAAQPVPPPHPPNPKPVKPSPANASPANPVETVVVLAPRTAAPGPGLSPTGSAAYVVTRATIAAMPQGSATPLSTVLTQLPGVSADQNQQIHIRDTEGPQFQYDIDGMLVPFDINTNPPFLSFLDARFIIRLTLLTGVLPSRYAYATGGVVDIATRQGCADPGGEASLTLGQRALVSPALTYGGCLGATSYVVTGSYAQGENAFSSATPGANPVHDETHRGNLFAHATHHFTDALSLSLLFSANVSNNQLPNQPNQTPAYRLVGISPKNSAAIDSMLNFQDYLGMAVLTYAPDDTTSLQIGYAGHALSENFLPDVPGELIYQGVASHAVHADQDHTLQADLTQRIGAHTLTIGAYLGLYAVTATDDSLVFPATPDLTQTSTTPIRLQSAAIADNVLSGIYIDDLWRLTPALKLNAGIRFDDLTGFTHGSQLSPTVNLTDRLLPGLTLHLGAMRAMQVPSFQGISPDTIALFSGTTASGPPGTVTPKVERDTVFDAGLVWHATRHLTVSHDVYYELTDNYLDTGQFGVIPIFAPFNYRTGSMWGVESGLRYARGPITLYANATFARNTQKGVATGQFNFDPDELAYINAHGLVVDHAPLFAGAAGAAWTAGAFHASLDGTYSSGLRGGFADTLHLPATFQMDGSLAYHFQIPGLPPMRETLTILNLLDRVNLIRPAEGIGIFQAAYGPRRTLLSTLSLSLGG